MRASLRPLPPDAGKEARGRVLIVGGSHRYPGAVLLAARAAARCGAGVVTVAAARSVVEMIAGHDPNVTFFPLAEAQPGVVATGAAAQVTPIFGDKIRAMLIGPGLAHVPTGAERVAFAERHASSWNAVVVLKGAVTVVSDGKKTYVHDAPNPTLGIGGSGDALGGAVAAFLARGLAPIAAAAAAVWVHGRAGALLASEIGESGALATDIVDAMPRALREILTK